MAAQPGDPATEEPGESQTTPTAHAPEATSTEQPPGTASSAPGGAQSASGPGGQAAGPRADAPQPASPGAGGTGAPPHPTSSPAAKHPRFRAPRPEFGKALARGASAASSKLTPLVARAGDTVAAASPMTVAQFVLGFLLIVSIIGAVSFDDTLGIAATILFVPVLAAAMGALGMRSFDARRRDRAEREQAQNQEHATANLERTLDYIDAKLTSALDRFGTDRHNDAIVAMFQAKAATELCLGPVPPGPSRNPQPAEPADSIGGHQSLADFLTPNALTRSERSEGVSRLLI
ncbi:hypothetical protein [Mycolicibacterium insubricum]|uniref:Uncharacterized protein n=1 Tax=Mycolicibacterium insubricum TaxID=444597 RepID=A0A1X0DKY5_9MYCO|nr:hypothetical protein [Mycolicibacterium insubricum]ORA73066.1 hypothetical protein BST26_03265 [Mycolicibacterium insubricum]